LLDATNIKLTVSILTVNAIKKNREN